MKIGTTEKNENDDFFCFDIQDSKTGFKYEIIPEF